MKAAIAGASAAGKPWVFDPVACFATAFRRQTAAELLALRPTIIRGNASEIIALGGGQSSGQGADAGDPVEQAEDAARLLARKQNAVVAVTGPVDFVTDGARAARISGGSPLMPKVTALGCCADLPRRRARGGRARRALRRDGGGARGLRRGGRDGGARGQRSRQLLALLFLDALYGLDALLPEADRKVLAA